MSASTAVPTVTNSWYDAPNLHVTGSIAVGASALTYSADGIACSFAVAGVHASRPPVEVTFTSQNGYNYAYVPGTTVSDGLLKILHGTTEETDGAGVAGGVSGDVIGFHAQFRGMF